MVLSRKTHQDPETNHQSQSYFLNRCCIGSSMSLLAFPNSSELYYIMNISIKNFKEGKFKKIQFSKWIKQEVYDTEQQNFTSSEQPWFYNKVLNAIIGQKQNCSEWVSGKKTEVLHSDNSCIQVFSRRFTLCMEQVIFQYRLYDFNTKLLSEVPFIFQPLKPFITFIKENIILINTSLNMPWWAVFIISSFFIRLTIFPLILLQMKKMSKLGPVSPLFAFVKETWRKSELPKMKRISAAVKIYLEISKAQNIKMRSIFVYNLMYYPLLITMIYSVRGLLSVDEIAKSGFLYLTNFADIDPYYILPTITIAAYYWNFERFITKENRHTLISKIKIGCQYLLILWYPFLCCWPSGIVLYMCSNAFISILQSTIMKTVWFQSKINPKIVHYNIMLSKAEIDQVTSASIMEGFKTGEESFKQKAIKEEVLVSETEEMLKKLNKGEDQTEDEPDPEEQIQANKNNNNDKKIER